MLALVNVTVNNNKDNPNQSDLKPSGRYILSHDKGGANVFSKSPR
jgi:hypothetical protein